MLIHLRNSDVKKMTKFSVKKIVSHRLKKKSKDIFDEKACKNEAENSDGTCRKKFYQKFGFFN